ncbi:MAG: hypothetical protein AAF693_21885 [Bacteroidota bacterium]
MLAQITSTLRISGKSIINVLRKTFLTLIIITVNLMIFQLSVSLATALFLLINVVFYFLGRLTFLPTLKVKDNQISVSNFGIERRIPLTDLTSLTPSNFSITGPASWFTQPVKLTYASADGKLKNLNFLPANNQVMGRFVTLALEKNQNFSITGLAY